MILLKCKICSSEADIIGNERAFIKKTKCRKCGHSSELENKGPEVFVIRKKSNQ